MRRLFRFINEHIRAAKYVFLLLLGVLMIFQAPLPLYVLYGVVGIAGFRLLKRYSDKL